jgi:GR25 family glycosyltransferase involved in LPS biosynthesis
MKIFIVHYKKLTDRKQQIINQMDKNGLTCEFIDMYDRDNLKEDEIKKFSIDRANIAISLSHLQCYEKILQEQDDYALILEDDVILDSDFNTMLSKYIKELPQDWDMLFIGDGCCLHIPTEMISPNITIYRKSTEKTEWGGMGATRCTDSYLVTKKCATKILEYSKNVTEKITLPIDHWLNDVLHSIQSNIYWAEPTIVTQGTQNGLYTSSH